MPVVKIKDWIARTRADQEKGAPRSQFTPYNPDTIARLKPHLRFSDDGCIIWTGPRDHKHGLPLYDDCGTVRCVRHMSWEAFFGPIPRTWPINPICGHSLCVNIHHLELTPPEPLVSRPIGRPKKGAN